MARGVTRRAVVAACAVGVAGCAGGPGASGGAGTPGDGGADRGRTTETEVTTMANEHPAKGDAEQLGDLSLSSPAFDDGGTIPREHGYRERNVNPPLSIGGVPPDASSLALVVDDPDAVEPAGKVWVHWLVWGIAPSRRDIPEGWDADGAVEGENDFGSAGYGGPAPPDREHTYRFKLYALDPALDVPAGAGRAVLGRAMRGRIVARTQLEGRYAP